MSSISDKLRWFQQVPALREPVVRVISAIEDLPGHWQILTCGLTFLVLCRGAKVEPFEILTMLTKMEADADAPFAKTFHAMKQYAENELNA